MLNRSEIQSFGEEEGVYRKEGRGLHLLLFEYAIRVEEWNDSIQEEGAGELGFHLGQRTLFVVCSLPPITLVGWLGQGTLVIMEDWSGGDGLPFRIRSKGGAT